MNQSCILTVFGFLILMISCDNNKEIEAKIGQMKSCPIDLCLDSLHYFSNSNCQGIDSLSFYNKNISLVVYSDSNFCTICGLKKLYQWYDVLSIIRDKYNGIVKVYFIFAPSKEQVPDLDKAVKTSLIDYPVFFDYNNVFARRNTNIPADITMHTFLLDENGGIILVGSPLDNMRIRKLFFDYLDKKRNDNTFHNKK